ncbi:MAG: phosphate signaling complex protein PhoU [Candidatus Cloacimonadales bacterium]|jgi:phosphate transport system protein|nr:phosphate signaling complex protein PhoU [Candidatus Cloacimonadota bacterium]MDY0381603.1 phosphate signaling complex protein PhoU [Candidatus Cloacimonadaceae bacterium]MCB5256774.1 phosphate signaling complex protein PhoU [Candidatus Cloacimonadota bacterium]MCB5264413.1 phosphate signaling complex protein PhoU [Candidatus Cloacimonadota bacterium]MCB5277568.1 phosphate signaling complex protein PhoU [Candidatus Cloacimonadota bacterium]
MLNTKLNDLKKMLLDEAALVEKMVITSMNALQNGNSCNLDAILILENKVNRLELDIESFCTSLIALYQPEATDLRIILMSYKINNDLERLGDQAVNIAESANAIFGEPIAGCLPTLFKMYQKAISMLHQSISAFIQRDAPMARQVCVDDTIVDDLNRLMHSTLIELMKGNPAGINTYMHLLRISKNLERVADLSTNIAENTVFLVLGKVIKHRI